MGENHVRVYNEMKKEVRLVAISDVNRERVEELAAKYETEYFTDYKEMLSKDIDAVSVVVPTTLHKQVVLDAFKAGKHVLVEKPITDTTKNADLMIAAAKEAGKILMVGHIERFNPAVIRLKEIVNSGIMGQIVSISAERVGPYNPRNRNIGVILDMGIHDIDIISYIYDKKINGVYAISGAYIDLFENYASIILRIDNKSAGVVETNRLTPEKIRKLSVIGDKGIAYLDYINQTVHLHDNEWIRKVKVEKSEPLKNELAYFINCVSTGTPPNPCGEDGKNALVVALVAMESSKEGKFFDI